MLHGRPLLAVLLLALQPQVQDPQPTPHLTLEAMVLKQARLVDEDAGFVTPLSISNTRPIQADPKLGVIVNRADLESIRDTSSVRQFEFIVRFLLAHEKAHHRQFREYGDEIDRAPAAERRVYECQADVLAAKTMLSLETTNRPQTNEAIVDALRVAFALGAKRGRFATHPEAEARRTAARFGMAAGTAVGLLRTSRDTHAPPLIRQASFASAAVLHQKIGIRQFDSDMSWSLRMCKHITGYRIADARDVVLESRKVSRVGGFMDYEAVYRNSGDRRLALSFFVQSVSAPRSNPTDTLLTQLHGSAFHTIELKPGESGTVIGRLAAQSAPWETSTLILAPSPTALVSIEEATAARFTGKLIDRGEDADIYAVSPTDLGLGLAVRQVRRAATAGFRTLRGGVGERVAGRLLRYPAAFEIPGAIGTTVRFWEGDERSGCLSALFYSGADDVSARQQYDKLVTSLRETLTDDEVHTTSGRTCFVATHDADVVVELDRDEEDGLWSVAMRFATDLCTTAP